MKQNTLGWISCEVPDYHYHMKPCNHVDGKYVVEHDAHFAKDFGYSNPKFPDLYLIHGSHIHDREGLDKTKWYLVDKTNGPLSDHETLEEANYFLETDSKLKMEVYITTGEFVEGVPDDSDLHHFNVEVRMMSPLEIKRHLEASDRMREEVDIDEEEPYGQYAKRVHAALKGKNMNSLTWARLAGGHGGMTHDDGHWRFHYENLHFKPEDWKKVEEITEDVY